MENPDNSGSNQLLAIILSISTFIPVYLFCINYVFKSMWLGLTLEEIELKKDQITRIAKYKGLKEWEAETLMLNNPTEFNSIISKMLHPVRVYE